MANKIKYILGIDGGGTKTIARLINIKTKEQWNSKSGSSSLSNDFEGALIVINELIEDLIIKSKCNLKEVFGVFGLAGSGNVERVNQLKKLFEKRMAKLDIYSDAITSAYGANLGEEIALVALGTGSVGLRMQLNEFEEMTEEIIGGWGFLICDEGGGAKLGYYSVKTLVKDFQKFGNPFSKLSISVANQISENKKLTRSDISEWLRNAKPVDFAKLSPLVTKHKNDCTKAKLILQNHAENVERLIKDTRGNTNLPVAILGGLAESTIPLLSNEMQSFLIEPKGNSLDGACLIALNELNKKT